MDAFPFTFNLIYEDKKETISPPLNFLNLKEKISELFSITEPYLYFKEKEIKNETDYFDLINEITDSKFLEAEINIFSEQQEKINEENEKKEEQENNNNILEIGVENKYDSFGDTRNRKGNQEEKYTNQNKGYYEQKRINYIKEKKEMQREEQEQEKENNKNTEEEEEEESNNKKKKKRKK